MMTIKNFRTHTRRIAMSELRQDKTAMYARDMEGGEGDARVYYLNQPMKYHVYDWSDGGNLVEHETLYVVVSAVQNEWVHETCIFPSDGSEVTHWGELYGSFQGDCDHEKALNDAGYRIVETIEGRVV
jgi:hypothetical protein